jgi:hypothetical protein
MSKYNGWSNKETWLLNLWYGEVLNDLIDEKGCQSCDDIKEFMETVLQECEPLESFPSGLYMDFINDALSQVDWRELAVAYNHKD